MRRVSGAWESEERWRCREPRGERRRLPPLQSYSRAAPTTISHCSSPDAASSCNIAQHAPLDQEKTQGME